jgi:3-isopropylmalate dehydrogenase
MKLLVLAGDDIGPEITPVAVDVLKAVDNRFGLGLEFTHADVGMKAHAKTGSTMPDALVAQAKQHDGVIIGPLGTYAYPPKEEGGINPSGGFRKALDLYANIRPAKTWPGVPSIVGRMDLVIARENTEGFYADRNMFAGSGEFMPTEDVALSVRKITRQGCERIARSAFELASRRRKKVAIIHKANVLKMTCGMFRDIGFAVARDYPEVEVEELIIDAAAAHLARRPESFDVLLTSNMYGDILSDLACELAGGLGMGASINVGDRYGIAQASHGSAPDIAGRDIANPGGLVLSAAMLLGWLGDRHGNAAFHQAQQAIEQAVSEQITTVEGRTGDLGGTAGTASFGRQLTERLAG